MTDTPTPSDKQRPAKEFRLGRMRAALWSNQGEHGPFYNLTVSRLYKDSEGNWRDSDSFGRDDLPLLQRVLDMAYLWQFEQGDKPAG